MSIRKKLTLVFLAMALLPLLFVSLVTFANYKKSLEEVRVSQLVDLAALKADRLEEYFSRLKAEIEMAQHFYNVKVNLPTLALLADYPAHPAFRASKAMLDGQLSKMQEALGLAGVILLDTEGKVVYTSDAASSATYFSRPLPGPDKKAFSEGMRGVYFSDIFVNPDKGDALEILVTAPAYDFSGTLAGVIAFEVNMASVTQLVQDTTGLGETGEMLIGKTVGDEVVFLNPLRHDAEAALRRKLPLGGALGGPAQAAALGETGSGRMTDYRGESVIAAWKPIPLLGWGMVAKIDTVEAFADATRLRNLLLAIGGLVVLLAGAAARSIARSISDPIQKLSEDAAIVGQGNLDHKVATEAHDEIGQLSRSFDRMIGNLKGVMASRDELNREAAERKEAEAALRVSEERWATTLASIGDGVIATDTRGRVTFLNAVAEKLTGWTMAEARDAAMASVFNIVNERTRLPVPNPALNALETGSIIALANHTVLIRKDKTEVPIDDSGAPIRDRDGNMAGAVLVFRDITERRLTEKAKNNFIAVLAHELRNPLAPLLLSIQKLEMFSRRKPGLPRAQAITPVLKESTDIALRQITMMARLLDDLLDVSRIERGKIELKMEKLDLAAALRHAVTSARPLINERGHALTVSMPAGEIVVEADPVRLEQVVVNLLNNAAKYTDRGGHIWLRAMRVGDTAEISIKDDGMGISGDKLQHVFEPFYQTEAALRRSGGGLGLGLMLVKSLLKMHNGSIEVKSKGEGKGCECIVRLPALPVSTPLAAPAKPVLPEGAPAPSRTGKKKILVVDDNHTIVGLTRDLLQHFGHDVVVAYDGESAVSLACAISPDVVLCDIGLPGIDGYEVARQIRTGEGGERRAVLVAVTGFGQEEDQRYAREAGFDRHLVKPAGIEALREAIS